MMYMKNLVYSETCLLYSYHNLFYWSNFDIFEELLIRLKYKELCNCNSCFSCNIASMNIINNVIMKTGCCHVIYYLFLKLVILIWSIFIVLLLNSPYAADNWTDYGLNCSSLFNKMHFVHVPNGQLPQDIMPTLFEGVLQKEIELMLQQFVYVDHFINLDSFNVKVVIFCVG